MPVTAGPKGARLLDFPSCCREELSLNRRVAAEFFELHVRGPTCVEAAYRTLGPLPMLKKVLTSMEFPYSMSDPSSRSSHTSGVLKGKGSNGEGYLRLLSHLLLLENTQRAQYGLTKEYTSSRVRDPYIIQGIFLNIGISGSPGKDSTTHATLGAEGGPKECPLQVDCVDRYLCWVQHVKYKKHLQTAYYHRSHQSLGKGNQSN